MPVRFQLPASLHELLALGRFLLKWGLLGSCVGLLSGSASALFLVTLARATAIRESHPWLLWLLPVAGAAVGAVYHFYGTSVEAGNNLLLDRIHDPQGVDSDAPSGSSQTTDSTDSADSSLTIPFRMAPLILIATVITHLFGGSAGREGTAVQMGATLANMLTRPLRLSPRDHRLLLMSGISGGFGSVFGTPLAGTVFGLEVLSVGRIGTDGLIPCFVAALTGDMVCRAWGVGHFAYPIITLPVVSAQLCFLIALVGVLAGLVARVFSELTHSVSHIARRAIALPWLRPAAGGAIVIALTYAVGTRDYLGLGLPLIARSFTPEGVLLAAFAWKIVFTAVTLGTGFKGGEVTPLFCIGATLGAGLAHALGQPAAFFAALGFVAVFAGAANTPLTCTLMGIELFGASCGVPFAAACLLSYLVSGHRGIYLSQRLNAPKASSILFSPGATLRETRDGAYRIEPSHRLLRLVSRIKKLWKH